MYHIKIERARDLFRYECCYCNNADILYLQDKFCKVYRVNNKVVISESLHYDKNEIALYKLNDDYWLGVLGGECYYLLDSIVEIDDLVKLNKCV